MKSLKRLALVALPMMILAGCESTSMEGDGNAEATAMEAKSAAANASAAADRAAQRAEEAARAAERAAAAAERAANDSRSAGARADRMFRGNLRK